MDGIVIPCAALLIVAIFGDNCAAVAVDDVKNSSVTQAVPVPAEAVNFMRQFGYLKKGSKDALALTSEKTIQEAVELVQRYGGLPETGVLDHATVKLMKSRRCGCPDILATDSEHGQDPGRNRLRRSRRKRYIIAKGWNKRNIKYKLFNWSSKMSQSDMAHEMQRAFDAWAMYSGLKFKRVDDPRQDADIVIQFSYGYHYDDFPFDGAGGVLAHAFYPYERAQFSGQIHFDEEEPWVINATSDQIQTGNAVDFYRVAVHELGHSLGLGHSHVTSSIMFPYYQGVNGAFVLGDDDVRAMHALYIARRLDDDDESTSEAPTREPRPPPSREPRPPPSPPPPRPTPPRPTPAQPTRPPPSPPTRQPPTRPYSPPRRRTTTSRPPTSTLTYEGDYEDVKVHKNHSSDHVHGHGPGWGHFPHHNHHGDHDQRPHQHTPSKNPSFPSPSGDGEGSHSKPDICSGNFGAVALLRGQLFVFKGTHLWRLSDRGHVMEGYPALIKQMFLKLPEGTVVDAAYQRSTDGNIILFAGKQMWVYTGAEFIEDSPRPLTYVGLPPELDRLDAAMVWSGNGATYFFREKQFWRFNETSRRIDAGYPLSIESRWRGIPSNIDAALSWKDGRTYFFKGSQYWEFESSTRKVSPDSPQPAVTYWLGC